MNFVDRLSLECMMNKRMYSKYQDALKKNQPTNFQQQKIQYKTDILNIVQRLLVSQTEEESTASDDIILHPKVIHCFNDFVSNCIENIQDFEDKLKKEKDAENEDKDEDNEDNEDNEDDDENEDDEDENDDDENDENEDDENEDEDDENEDDDDENDDDDDE